MSEVFTPAWWIRGPHAQTLWGIYFRKQMELPLRRERLELDDGDFLDLDWLDQKDKTRPVVLLLHGVTGSIYSHYAKGLLKAFHQQGWRAVFMHFRGCSEEPNRLLRGYHCGDTEDLQTVVNLLVEREQAPKIAVVGISLGGIVLLRWLNDTANNNPVNAATAVSIPFDLEAGLKFVRSGPITAQYEKYMLRDLKSYALRKFRTQHPLFSIEDIEKTTNFHEFDNLVTAPLHGYKDAHDYYAQTSVRKHLDKISTPTLIVHAKDDPFAPREVIPNPADLSKAVNLELQERGGHVGFIANKGIMSPDYWLETRIPLYLKQHL
jgi:uncharacterized protein